LILADAQRFVAKFVKHYNTERLHRVIGYVTPEDKLFERETAIFTECDGKLQAAREKRAVKRSAEKGRLDFVA
jgi:hypothetical protein